jgi:hypothetical protein
MSHGTIVTTPPTSTGGGSRVASEVSPVRIEYFPDHSLTHEQQDRLAEKVQRMSDKISRLASGHDED